MSMIDTEKGKAALRIVAAREGKSLAEVEKAAQEAIDLAWENPEAMEYQSMLFPQGKPTAAEFIGRMAQHIKVTALDA